jgi:DNA modification methylase
MSADIIRGDALALPLADASVDLVVTSPPYFGLRSYQDGGEHYPGQLGSEATPAEFVDALLAATREMVRVLKPSGSLWLNLGDKYAMDSKWGGRSGIRHPADSDQGMAYRARRRTGVQSKSLIGIPWRYALRCIDDLGLILRAEVIWSKPNGLPESVTDRVRRSHEQWFHFVKSPRYFSAVDEVREASGSAMRRTRTPPNKDIAYGDSMNGQQLTEAGLSAALTGRGWTPNQHNPLGKLPGSVWVVPTQPLTVPEHLGVDHFAAFPMEWPRRIIRGWAPTRGVCTACGEGRRPVRGGYACACTPRTSHRGIRGDWREGRVVNLEQRSGESETIGNLVSRRPGGFGTKVALSEGEWEYHLDDWTPAPTTPARILDPFGGTGTTALVAKALGCHGISLDMSADYNRLATWRTQDPDQLAAASEIRRSDAAREADRLDMEPLFEMEAG